MATIRKLKSKRFLAEVRKHGQNISKTFDTKVQAMRWAIEMEQTLSKDGLVKGKTLGDVFNRYRDEISPTKKSQRNEVNRLNRLLKQSISSLLLSEIGTHHVELWIQERLSKNKSSSVNRDLNCISAVLE